MAIPDYCSFVLALFIEEKKLKASVINLNWSQVMDHVFFCFLFFLHDLAKYLFKKMFQWNECLVKLANDSASLRCPGRVIY